MLRAKGKGGAIFLTQSLQFVLTLGAASLLVPHLGITGFGIACLCGLLGYIPLDIGARRIVPYTYAAVVPWLAVFAPVLIFQDIPLVYRPFLFIPLLISFVVPHTRHLLRDYALEVVRALGLWTPESVS